MKSFLLLGPFLATIISCSADPAFVKDLEDGVYGHIVTEKGDIVLKLFYKRAPLTVSNFVGLSEGVLENSHITEKPYYNGLTFHRVVADFVIQGGDPEGTGSGGPGYNFPDEFHPELRHNKKGILSMANSGENTNGSQFFITLAEAPWLDDKHSVFGEVVLGMDVVESIEESDSIVSASILRVGSDAKGFSVSQERFDALAEEVREDQRRAVVERKNAAIATIKERWSNLTEHSTGLYFEVLQQGSGATPSQDDLVTIHYSIETLDGTFVDSSYREGAESPQFRFMQDRVLYAWEIAIAEMQVGEKRRVISPPELSFGAQGLNGFIGPNEYVYYELELVSIGQ